MVVVTVIFGDESLAEELHSLHMASVSPACHLEART
jgi:hypothetical protein